MNELRIAYEPDDEWTGKVRVNVRSGDFAGVGEAWVAAEQIEAFSEALTGYPLKPDAPCLLEGGHGGSLDGAIKPQTLVSVAIKPVGLLGELLVVVKLETDIENEESRDALLFQSVEARFLANYSAVGYFSLAVGALMRGKEEAVLLGAD